MDVYINVTVTVLVTITLLQTIIITGNNLINQTKDSNCAHLLHCTLTFGVCGHVCNFLEGFQEGTDGHQCRPVIAQSQTLKQLSH